MNKAIQTMPLTVHWQIPAGFSFFILLSQPKIGCMSGEFKNNQQAGGFYP